MKKGKKIISKRKLSGIVVFLLSFCMLLTPVYALAGGERPEDVSVVETTEDVPDVEETSEDGVVVEETTEGGSVVEDVSVVETTEDAAVEEETTEDASVAQKTRVGIASIEEDAAFDFSGKSSEEEETEGIELKEQTIQATIKTNGPRKAPAKDAAIPSTSITLTGLLPVDGTVEATPVSVEIEEQQVLLAYDITIFASGEDDEMVEWQPEEAVEVAVQSTELEDGTTVSIYHMEDEDSEAEQVTEVEVEDGEVSFEAGSFSIYALAVGPLRAAAVKAPYDSSRHRTMRCPQSPLYWTKRTTRTRLKIQQQRQTRIRCIALPRSTAS